MAPHCHSTIVMILVIYNNIHEKGYIDRKVIVSR